MSVGALAPETTDRLADRFGYGAGWLVGNLPVVMAEDPFLARFVTIFEEIASSVRYGADSCVAASDVTIASPTMLRFLAGWIGAPDLGADLPLDDQRRIVRAAGAALRWRGTAVALASLLEAVTGGPVDVDDPGGVFPDGGAPAEGPSVVVVRTAGTGRLRPHELVELVRNEVPAHLPIAVIADSEVLWPPADRTDHPNAAEEARA